MMEFAGLDDNGEVIRYSPCLELETEIGRIALTYLNTRMRLFGNPEYNHIEFSDEEHGTLGMRANDELMDILYEREYPMQYDPYPDRYTEEWYIQLNTRDLDAEIDSL
jgi:hypothetical protein